MWRDLRLTGRMLLKRPAFTALAVLTLALGIGAATAVFTLVEGVLLTPPPYAMPERLVLVPSVRVDGEHQERLDATPASQWIAWQQQSQSLDGIAAYSWTFNFLVDTQGSESLEGMVVTPEYFNVTGVQPFVGRAFTASDAQSGNTIIIGYDLWRRRFSSDPHVLGKTFRMSRRETPPTIVGIMPPGIRFLPSPTESQEPSYNVDAAVDFWIPGRPNPQRLSQSMWHVVARLKPSATIQQAQSELSMLALRQAANDRDTSGRMPRVQSLVGETGRNGRRILLPLFGAAGLVLLIACGNTAALLLIHGLQRQHEYAIQSALGVRPGALFRQAGLESVLLALAGGAVGIGLATGIVRIFALIGGGAIPRLDAVHVGWPLLVTGMGFALVAALVAGVAPAIRATRHDPIQALKSAGPRSGVSRGERRLLRLVTTVQTALTLTLLVGAGLLIRTMHNVAAVRAGYTTDRVLTMTVTAVQGDLLSFHQRALERVSALPGLQRAAFAWGTPLTGNDWPGLVEIEGHPVVTPQDRISVPLRSVTPGYFDLLGVPIVQGRDFNSSDTRNATNVAIVNQALVDRYFQSATPIGKKIWGGGRDRPPVEIVGVVGDARTNDLTRVPQPEIYLSLWQATPFSKDLLVRTQTDPRAMLEAIRRELRAVDPTVAIEHVKPLEEIRDGSVASRTFATRLVVGFAVAALLLTVVGIYGVMALSVGARRREIAIRAAVGAQRSHIRQLVLRDGLRLVATGLALGLIGALIMSRVLQAFLFEVTPTDAATLAGAVLLFAAISLVACWTPARRATSIEPLEVLRGE